MKAEQAKNKLTLTAQFDMKEHPEAFGKFCKALIDAGFDAEIKELAQMLLKEAKRRKLPIAAKLEKRIRG